MSKKTFTANAALREQQTLINPGEILQVPLPTNSISLKNKGGTLTLLDKQGIKIYGVYYTKEDVQKQGKTVVF